MRLSSKKMRKALSLFFSAAVMICLTALTAVHACAAVDGGAVSPVKAFTFDTVSIIMAAGIGVLVIAFVVVLILFIKSMKKSKDDSSSASSYAASSNARNKNDDYFSKQTTQIPQGYDQNYAPDNRAGYAGASSQGYPNYAASNYQASPSGSYQQNSYEIPDTELADEEEDYWKSSSAGYGNKPASDYLGRHAANEPDYNRSDFWNPALDNYQQEPSPDDYRRETVAADYQDNRFETPPTRNYQRPSSSDFGTNDRPAYPTPEPAAFQTPDNSYMEGTSATTVLNDDDDDGVTGFVLQRRNGQERVNIDKSEFIIGKERAKVDYCVTNNNSVSRRHAKIRVQSGTCYLSDLGSTNCTYINGVKVSPGQEVALMPGDVIKLSNEEFDFLG